MDKNKAVEYVDGVIQTIDSEGRLVLDIDLFDEEEAYMMKYNGHYIFRRTSWGQRKLMFKAQKAMKSTDSVDTVLAKISKTRKISVRQVAKLMQEDKLTPKEEEMINEVAESDIDFEKLYSIAPELFQQLLVESPVPMIKEEDLDGVDMGFVVLLFNRVSKWTFKTMVISGKRRKK